MAERRRRLARRPLLYACGFAAERQPVSRLMNEDIPRAQPVGVTLLAILNLVSGVAIVLIMLFMGGGLSDIDADLRKIGASAVLARLSALLLGLLFIGTGVALWSGRTRGWWFATWVTGMMGARTFLAAVMVGDIASKVGASPGAVAPRRITLLVRGVLYLAILAYLFKPNVLEFFRIGSQSRGRTLLRLAGAVAVGVALWSLGGLLSGG